MSDLTEPTAVDGKVYCGAVFVPAGTTFTKHYEVAAWWTELTTQEDRWYPVFATRDHIYSTKWNLWAKVDVEVTEAYLPSLFGGVAYGTQPQGKRHRSVGEQEQWTMNVTPQMFEDKYLPVTLGFSAVQNFYVHAWPGQHRDGIYHSSNWEWRPYNELGIVKLLEQEKSEAVA